MHHYFLDLLLLPPRPFFFFPLPFFFFLFPLTSNFKARFFCLSCSVASASSVSYISLSSSFILATLANSCCRSLSANASFSFFMFAKNAASFSFFIFAKNSFSPGSHSFSEGVGVGAGVGAGVGVGAVYVGAVGALRHEEAVEMEGGALVGVGFGVAGAVAGMSGVGVGVFTLAGALILVATLVVVAFEITALEATAFGSVILNPTAIPCSSFCVPPAAAAAAATPLTSPRVCRDNSERLLSTLL